MERPAPNQELPLEVVTRCLRERGQAGAWADAERIFGVVQRRIQRQTAAWAHRVANQARSETR